MKSVNKTYVEMAKDMVFDEILKEQENITSANSYLNFFDGIDISNFEDLQSVLQEFLDEYISASDATEIIGEFDKYIQAGDDLEAELAAKYGATSKKYEEIYELLQRIRCTSPRVKNIWEVKQYDRSIFNKLLKIAIQENKKLMQNQSVVRRAFLRFYIQSVISDIKDSNLDKDNSIVFILKNAINIGIAMHQMEFFSRFTDEKTLEKFHSIGASANKKKRDAEKNSDISQIAKEAWEYGCELLHTQMLFLFILTKKIDFSKEVSVKNKLRKEAPANRIYGQVASKIIDECPCDKVSGCPLVQKIPMKKQLALPVSKRHFKPGS